MDAGALVRWLHLISAVVFGGLLAATDWVLGPVLLTGAREPLRRVAAALLPALRWSGAVAWISGMTYALGWLARQHPDGAGRWLVDTDRGRWVALGGSAASVTVFLAWFALAPLWEQLSSEGLDDGTRERLLTATRRCSRLAAALLLPVVFAMGAARHLGETGGPLPAEFGSVALVVLVGGTLAGALLSGAAAALARRAGSH